MSGVSKWLSMIFNEYLTVPRLCFFMSVLFGLAVLVMMLINANGSSMARTKHAERKMAKFYKKNDTIDYYNVFTFKRKCISKLPRKARKAWDKFEKSGVPLQNSGFEMTLRESVNKGGAIGFGVYLYYYIAVMAVLVLSMMFTDMPQEISSVYVCICLVIGAIGLFILGLQLYFMDKRAEKRVENVIAEMYSRILVYKPKMAKSSSQPTQTIKLTNVEPLKTFDKGIEPVGSLSKITEPISGFNNLDRINSSLSSLNERVNKADYLNEAAPIESEQKGDAIDRLNVLVCSILESGGSPELIKMVHKALLEVYEARFTRPIDDLRMKCILKKLDKAM